MAIDPNISKHDQVDLEDFIKQQDRLAKEKVQREERNAFRTGILKKIAHHITVDNFIDEEKAKLVVLGIDCSWAISIDQDYSGDWHRKATGRYSVTVLEPSSRYDRASGRSYDTERRRRFPQRKDGSHNYQEIANLVVQYAERKKSQIEADAARKSNLTTVNMMRAKLKLNRYDSVMGIFPSTNGNKPYRVEVKLNCTMNPVQLQALHAALLKLGLVKEEEDTSRCVSDY